MKRSIWIGYDPREVPAYAVARRTVAKHLTQSIPIRGVRLNRLQELGLYRRPTKLKVNGDGHFEMIDELSVTPDYHGRLSTQHANARFLVPHLAGSGWALFMDGDMMVRANLARMFEILDPAKALYCVKHDYEPPNSVKMDGQIQTKYSRKNWSSFVAFNCDHDANQSLTMEMVNALPGRDLHRFCWIADDNLIGELPLEWNWLVRHSPTIESPKVVHFTEGCPNMPGYENDPYADEWRQELDEWADGI